MQIALFALGVALIGCGVWLLVRPKVAGAKSRNTIELLGMKFQVAGPALVFVGIGGAMALAAAGIVGPETKPEPVPTPDPKPAPAPAVAFTRRYSFPPENIRQMAPKVAPAGPQVLVLEQCEFGRLGEAGVGMRVTLGFQNTEKVPVTLKVEQQYFGLRDDRSRTAKLVSLDGPVVEEILSPQQKRTMVVVFNTTGMHGKENGARTFTLEITHLLGRENAEWEITPLPVKD